jgi:preprotein translocase subunit SecG
MISTLIVLMIVVAVLLIIVILMQNPKGGGLSSEFGGGSTQMFGVQRTGDILEKGTWGFFTFILVGCIVASILVKMNKSDGTTSSDVNVESSVAIPQTASPAGAPAASPAPAPSKDSTK